MSFKMTKYKNCSELSYLNEEDGTLKLVVYGSVSKSGAVKLRWHTTRTVPFETLIEFMETLRRK